MPKATDHPTPSRRVFIGAATIGLFAGPDVAAAVVPATHRDAELLNLLAHFEAVQRRINGLWSGTWRVAPGPNYIADDDEREAATEPLENVAAGLLDRIIELPAFTPEAWRAKARCVLLMDADYRAYSRGEGDACDSEQLLASLLCDLAGGPMSELDRADTPLVALPQIDAEPEATRLKLTDDERAAVEAEDPMRARFQSPPFREQFPLWTRSPVTPKEWQETARQEFIAIVICQALQRQNAAKLEELWRVLPEDTDDSFQAFVRISRRYAKMANALHGEAIRLVIARARARGDELTDGILAALAMGQLIEAEA